MGARVVGLDVGTHAVRAVELALGRDAPTLTRFGQVALPYGAVRDGEVSDVHAVAAAIRRLWSEAGFKTRDVIVGVGNQRVVIRQADLPSLSDEDLRSALRYEVQELIPIPIDDAVLDVDLVDRYVDDEGQERMRVLLVAAQRDMVRSLLAAVDAAGLSVSAVDAVPFALLRTVGVTCGAPAGGAEAVVDVGAGVTTVAVHQRGVPRFVRMLIAGGNDLTDAIAGELGLDVDSAEELKRRADLGAADELAASAARTVDDRLGPFLEDVRGSLDYYLAQPDSAPLARVLVTGGGATLPGLAGRLQTLLGAPVDVAHPLSGMRSGRTGLAEPLLLASEPLLATAIGLALGARPGEGRRRLSLLPDDVAAARRDRRNAALAGAGVAALAGALGLAWFAQGSQVAAHDQRAAKAAARGAQLQARIGDLQDAATLEAQLQQRRGLVQAALADDVAWSRVLQEVAASMPDDVWLTSFNGTKANGSASGSIEVTAMGFDHTSAARWLLRLDEVPSINGVWLPSSTRTGTGERSLVTFQSTANLTERARSDRAARYLDRGA